MDDACPKLWPVACISVIQPLSSAITMLVIQSVIALSWKSV
jgi:hypothetical protein